ncbi:autotransporter outer membrane beta-barrel domain-containing protein [Herminiimonas contaminans]|uniref:Autotransporter outer membrane beta-barrel domain-containing protein n=2 Tax=Herminiimonas contaminans TaxID=1111140 RepID=A0ABS0EVV9_9BURK|nr:autotransporter outer membrane beta-barrel domain-containing protein [Herminiimonas contaminans]
MQQARAQSVSSTGDLSSLPPGGAQNWDVGGDLAVGDTGIGTLLIDAGGTVTNDWAYIGNTGTGNGTITVQGTDGMGNASTWTSSGRVLVGVSASSIGALNILNGGVVRNSGSAVIGYDGGSTGTVLVSGAGSTWENPLTQSFQIGTSGNGTLLINNGGTVHSGQAIIGFGGGSNGHVTVTGLGSLWDPVDNIYVGFVGTGELNVLEGATVSTMQNGGGAATIYVGYANGGQGTVNVSSSTGNTSTLSVTDDLAIGVDGLGTVNVDKGGLITVGDDVQIGNNATGNGTLHLNGDASGRGIVETGSVVAGAGTINLDLNGGILRANRNETNFLNGFTGLTVGTEGAWFDTNGHTIAISTAFTGNSTFNKLGTGTLILTGDSSTFTGNSAVSAGTLQMDGILAGAIDVQSGARLTGIGQVGITTNRGVIAPGHSSTLGTLTVAGNYTPAGGSIEIRTQLGDDSSATDRLVITGSTSGATPVKVTNFGGAGAQTTEGIRIIEVQGASNGTFSLVGNTTFEGQQAVVAGAYAYRLYAGGASTPADGSWYLRSALMNVASTPLYQPGVPSYEAYPQILLGLNGLPTLQQRVGNRFWNDGSSASAKDNGRGVTGAFTETNGMWVRVEGGHNRMTPKESTSGSDYQYDTYKMQGGIDAMLTENNNGKLVGSALLHYVHGSAKTSWRYGVNNYGSGNISTNGYGVGGALTWYGANGFYVDGMAQLTWYSSNLSANSIHSLKSGNHAFGQAWSVESGKRVKMNGNWSVTPQAQLTYSKASFNDFTDVFGASVRQGRDDSLQGRLGLSLDYQENRTRLYGIANLYNEFFDGTSVTVADRNFASRNDRLWAGLGFGGSHNWNNDKYSVYGEVSYNSSLASSDSYGYGGKIGMRIKW